MTSATSQDRLARLTERVSGLARRRGGGPTDRWLLMGGAIAIPLGVILILLGWYGVAHTAVPFEQTPYVVSGGLLGLAFVIGGGFLYFCYWTTVGIREARADRERVAAHQDRLEQLIGELTDRLAPATAAPARLVSTRTGSMVHRADCAAVAGLDVIETAAPTGLRACSLCRPLVPTGAYDDTTAAPSRRTSGRAPRQRATR